MTKPPYKRPEFRNWVDRLPEPSGEWRLMPLTHITRGIVAQDITRDGEISPSDCKVFKEKLAYFFYGRPAYRIAGNEAVKVEAACPYCFIFDEALISQAKAIYAFDTGAFDSRLYKHALMDEMDVEDFSLETEATRPNRIIASVFRSMSNYFEGDTTKIPAPETLADNGDFHARAYLQLLTSSGRNEPDDRICSIEIVCDKPIALMGNLKAVVVPHTLWEPNSKTGWLENLEAKQVRIEPYNFVPGRHPEHYHALMEIAVRNLYNEWGLL